MSSKNCSNKINKFHHNAIGWDAAIREGEKQLKVWRSKVARLMDSIQTFREAKERGDPWPGEEGKKAGTADAIPAQSLEPAESGGTRQG